MEVFRITREIYADRLTVSGSRNRWNTQGQYVIYAGSSRSLSILESAVHKKAINLSEKYKIMIIHIPDDDRFVRQILTKDLPPDWTSVAAYSTLQAIGSDWYKRQETLILKVPSAIINQEYNYAINTEHPDFANNVQLIRTEDYFWDSRLL